MYFMHLWKRAEEKNHANKKQSPRICFTAVKLSTLWMIYSRGNNKRNSWSNYQPDKNALNFKKGFRLEAPATNPASWVSGIGDTSSSPDCRTAAVSAGTQPHSPFKQEVSKILSLLQTGSEGDTATAGALPGRGERKRTSKTTKKKEDTKSMHFIYSSWSILMPLFSKMLSILILSMLTKDCQLLYTKQFLKHDNS